jgi:hypothetical protein
VVKDGEIVIVDEFTGRLMEGRQWSDGLHQAVEAKESRVTIKQETQTLATITLQNLFKLYEQLAGMTGTALTESEEFMKIYRLEVFAIPTNKPVRRIDYNDKIYKDLPAKFNAIVEEIRAYSQDGYPADPFSLADALRYAERTLVEAHELLRQGKGASLPDGADELDYEGQLRTVREALREFRDGAGPGRAAAGGVRGGHGAGGLGAAGAGRHGERGELGEAQRGAAAPLRCRARGAQREEPRPRGGDRHQGGPAAGDHPRQEKAPGR